MLRNSPNDRPESKKIYDELKIVYTKNYIKKYNTGIISSLYSLGSFPNLSKLLLDEKITEDKFISYQCIQCINNFIDNIKN